jgi:hypothetical protein
MEDQTSSIEVVHKMGLPGLDCPKCGPWGTAGLEYPMLTVKGKEFSSSWPVRLEEFNDIKIKLKQIVGDAAFEARLWRPGTCIGPLTGKGRGKKFNSIVIAGWSLLIEDGLFNALSQFFPLEGVKADIKWGKIKGANEQVLPTFVEVEVRPTLDFWGDEEFPICEICGRQSGSVPQQIKIRSDSYDSALGLYRGNFGSTVLFCSEAFRNKACELAKTEIVYTCVDVV